MSIWELRDYYQRQYDEIRNLDVPEGPERESLDRSVAYFAYLTGLYAGRCAQENRP